MKILLETYYLKHITETTEHGKRRHKTNQYHHGKKDP